MNRFLSMLFSFTRRELKGAYVLSILILMGLILPSFISAHRPVTIQSASDIQELNELALELSDLDSSYARKKQPILLIEKDKVHNKSVRETFREPIIYLPAQKKEPFQIAINQVSAEELMKVKGIGPVLSQRIIKFRNKLGGFYSLDQLFDVYGLDPDVAQRLIQMCKNESLEVAKIDVMKASYGRLIAHPYISKEQTVLILKERRKSKSFDPEHLMASDTTFNWQKVFPYLEW